LESTLELHKRDTISTFGTRSGRRTGRREKTEIEVNRLNERVRASIKLYGIVGVCVNNVERKYLVQML